MPEALNKLFEIVAAKRKEVETQLDGLSVESLRAWARPTKRSLKAALARPGARFVFEIKRASPSAGPLRSNADPTELARAYSGPADAISILTDRRYFNGSLDDLVRARAHFEGPILAKDFFIDPRQVTEARIHGADAILVLLSALPDDQARLILDEARLCGMDALVEVHDERELGRAISLGASLVGINNRNLRTFGVDIGVTRELASKVPPNVTLVSESGIQSRRDVEWLAPYADAFLVGSALMRADSPALAAREIAFGRVKICGLTTIEDVEYAASSGASHAGINFVTASPRSVTSRQAEPIVEAARRRGLKSVGVFCNQIHSHVAAMAKALRLEAVQLHGSEDEKYIDILRKAVGESTEVWAASPVGNGPIRIPQGADRIVFDNQSACRPGGTGKTFDWSRLQSRVIQRALLAGGLNPSNAKAAAATGAWALDVASGVERAPGKKDTLKLSAFFEALRPASRAQVQPCN